MAKEAGGSAGNASGAVIAVKADNDVRRFCCRRQENLFYGYALENECVVRSTDGGAGAIELFGACGGAHTKLQDIGIGLRSLAARPGQRSAQFEALDLTEGNRGALPNTSSTRAAALGS